MSKSITAELRKSVFDALTDLAMVRHDVSSRLAGEVEYAMSPDEVLDALDRVTVVLYEVEGQLTPTVRPPEFYPLPGTVFVYSGDPNMSPCFVEEKKDRTRDEYGCVAFYDRSNGMGDHPNWLDDVRSDRVRVIWCPSIGSVPDNQVYLTHWEI